LLTHGQRRRYGGMNAPRIRELVEQFAADEQPWDVRPELDVARALFRDWIERYDEFTAALAAWYDTWEGKYIPLGAENKRALLDVLEEYEAILRESDPTETQETQLARARAAVDFLASPQAPKPRVVLDVSDAIKHVDVISKV